MLAETVRVEIDKQHSRTQASPAARLCEATLVGQELGNASEENATDKEVCRDHAVQTRTSTLNLREASDSGVLYSGSLRTVSRPKAEDVGNELLSDNALSLPVVADWEDDEDEEGNSVEVPQKVDEMLRQTMTASRKELKELCTSLRMVEQDCGNATDVAEMPVVVDPLEASTREVPVATPRADELAARIAQLPRDWRGALLQLLQEAEMQASSSSCE